MFIALHRKHISEICGCGCVRRRDATSQAFLRTHLRTRSRTQFLMSVNVDAS